MVEEEMVEALLGWFTQTKRDLPWRKSYNPYHVWISEIMLQQTQMERGVRYFLRWIERFPKVSDVAEASEEDILKYWEGLGYYARARNLHKAAKQLVSEFGGEVPCDYEQLLVLPGIGPYTAAAVASVAGNRDVVVVDANVLRVFARLLDIAEPIKKSSVQKSVRARAEELLPKGRARQYNQALMDLGGLICTPKNPLCSSCPIADSCLALKKGTVAMRPITAKPKDTVYLHKVAGLVRWGNRLYIQKRAQSAVWGGLWEFPGGEYSESSSSEPDLKKVQNIIRKDSGLEVKIEGLLCTVQHQYTNHKITLDCYLCEIVAIGGEPVPELSQAVDYRWVEYDELADFGFPAGPRKVIEFIKEQAVNLFGHPG